MQNPVADKICSIHVIILYAPSNIWYRTEKPLFVDIGSHEHLTMFEPQTEIKRNVGKYRYRMIILLFLKPHVLSFTCTDI